MKKIKLDDMDVLAGLEWSALPQDQPEKKAMAELLAQTKGVNKGIVIRSNGITAVGRPAAKGPVPKVPSAVALLAFANQKVIQEATGGSSEPTTSEEHNWIVAEQVTGSEEEMWLGIVKNGVPVPGGDIVGTRAHIITELTEFLGQSNTFTVFTVDKEVRYNVIGQVTVVEKRFAELVQGVPPAKAKPALFSVGGIVAGVILVLAVVLTGLWWGYSAWAEKSRQAAEALSAAQQQEAAAQQQAADKETYEKSVREAMILALKQGVDEINISLSSPSPYENIQAWRDLIYQTNMYQSGWQMQDINCSMEAETTPICRVSLIRGDLGVNRMLMAERPDAVIDGDNAQYTIRMSALGTRPAAFDTIVPSIGFTNGIMSDLQQVRNAGVQHAIQASQEIVKQAPLPAPPASVPVEGADPAAAAATTTTAAIQMGVAQGKLVITGQEMWQLAGVARYLDQANIKASELAVKGSSSSSSGNGNWSLTLEYFVRTLPQPVLPTVPFGADTITIELPAEYRARGPVDEGGIKESSVDATELSDVVPEQNADENGPPGGPEIPPPVPAPPSQ